MKISTRISPSERFAARFKRVQTFLNRFSLQNNDSFDRIIFAFTSEFNKTFPDEELRILLLCGKESWQYSDKNKSLINPKYTGFSNHLKIIQNVSLYKGRAYRREPSLNHLFSQPEYILGLPSHLMSGKKIWILINAHDRLIFRASFPVKMKSMLSRLTDILERADYSEIEKIAGQFKAQEEAVATLVHQLKSPLSMLSQSLKLAQEKNQSSEKVIRECRSSVNNTRSMISAYLDFMKIREVKLIPMDLREVIRELKKYYRFSLKGAGITIHTAFHPPGKSFQILGNLFHIFQVLQNLVENAIHAIQANGEISIAVSRSEVEEDNATAVEIRVSDSGPGVDAVIADRIFEPFVSGFKSGHGFGLSICKRTMELHGGSITYVSPEKDKPGYFLLKFRSV